MRSGEGEAIHPGGFWIVRLVQPEDQGPCASLQAKDGAERAADEACGAES